MKKFLNILILFMLTAMPAFCETLTYSSIPVKDEKTGFEVARVIVPENFEVSSTVEWTRDFENPAKLYMQAKSKESDVTFSYLSSKSPNGFIQYTFSNSSFIAILLG